MGNQSSPDARIDKKESLRRWGIFILGASLLGLMQEWLEPADWLGYGIFFAYALVFAPDSASTQSWSRALVRFFAGAVLVVIAAVSLAGFSLVSGLGAGTILFVVCLVVGLALVGWSSMISSQQDLPSDNMGGKTETSEDAPVQARSVVGALIERIKRI